MAEEKKNMAFLSLFPVLQIQTLVQRHQWCSWGPGFAARSSANAHQLCYYLILIFVTLLYWLWSFSPTVKYHTVLWVWWVHSAVVSILTMSNDRTSNIIEFHCPFWLVTLRFLVASQNYLVFYSSHSCLSTDDFEIACCFQHHNTRRIHYFWRSVSKPFSIEK